MPQRRAEGPFVKDTKQRNHDQNWKPRIINVLKLKSAKFGIMTFTKMFPPAKVVQLQIDNAVAFSYLKMMGVLSNLAQKIWDYLLANGITTQEADFQSHLSEWIFLNQFAEFFELQISAYLFRGCLMRSQYI